MIDLQKDFKFFALSLIFLGGFLGFIISEITQTTQMGICILLGIICGFFSLFTLTIYNKWFNNNAQK
ncbi:hypothetical protein [Gottfriedia solisilvae]|uniref:hypothetical protein n=1 Tax=Gottfriedia solisilvae TaxID=1516104 RepID=UPI003D2EC7F5